MNALGLLRSESVRLVATLTVAGLVSGVAIVFAFRATAPRIRANQAAALERAVLEVLPGAERMERRVWDGQQLAPGVEGQGELDSSIFLGYAGGDRLVGYAVPAAGAGFQDTIKLIYGLDAAGAHVIGLYVLESRETPGLGDRIFKDEKFVAEFHGLAVEPVIELVKGHGAEPNEVDAITGATISSRAVVKILNGGNALWRPRLPAPGAAPAAATEPDRGALPPDVDRGGPVPGGRAGEGR